MASDDETDLPAPILSIYDITSDTAMVQMKQCESSTLYSRVDKQRISHREVGTYGANTEEEEVSVWKVREMSSSQYALTDLTVFTKYELSGEYRSKGQWSDESEIIQFVTMDRRTRLSIIFMYWLRTMIPDKSISNKLLIDVIGKYF